ncbi:hypothetical protein GCM10027256_21450 [Novispirillum itersonii subsp. nipponicum]
MAVRLSLQPIRQHHQKIKITLRVAIPPRPAAKQPDHFRAQGRNQPIPEEGKRRALAPEGANRWDLRVFQQLTHLSFPPLTQQIGDALQDVTVFRQSPDRLNRKGHGHSRNTITEKVYDETTVSAIRANSVVAVGKSTFLKRETSGSWPFRLLIRRW